MGNNLNSSIKVSAYAILLVTLALAIINLSGFVRATTNEIPSDQLETLDDTVSGNDITLPDENLYSSEEVELTLTELINIVREGENFDIAVANQYSTYTITINDNSELENLSNKCNSSSELESKYYLSLNYLLCNDIELVVDEYIESIGNTVNAFTGTFNGSNYTLSNINIQFNTLENSIGLFGVNEGTISNLNIQGFSNIKAVDNKTLTYEAEELSQDTEEANLDVEKVYQYKEESETPLKIGIVCVTNKGQINNVNCDISNKNITYDLVDISFAGLIYENTVTGVITDSTFTGNNESSKLNEETLDLLSDPICCINAGTIENTTYDEETFTAEINGYSSSYEIDTLSIEYEQLEITDTVSSNDAEAVDNNVVSNSDNQDSNKSKLRKSILNINTVQAEDIVSAKTESNIELLSLEETGSETSRNKSIEILVGDFEYNSSGDFVQRDNGTSDLMEEIVSKYSAFTVTLQSMQGSKAVTKQSGYYTSTGKDGNEYYPVKYGTYDLIFNVPEEEGYEFKVYCYYGDDKKATLLNKSPDNANAFRLLVNSLTGQDIKVCISISSKDETLWGKLKTFVYKNRESSGSTTEHVHTYQTNSREWTKTADKEYVYTQSGYTWTSPDFDWSGSNLSLMYTHAGGTWEITPVEDTEYTISYSVTRSALINTVTLTIKLNDETVVNKEYRTRSSQTSNYTTTLKAGTTYTLDVDLDREGSCTGYIILNPIKSQTHTCTGCGNKEYHTFVDGVCTECGEKEQ